MNTVHVYDVVRAVWHLCRHGARSEVYNLADKGDTSMSEMKIFCIYLRFCKCCSGDNVFSLGVLIY